MLNRVILMGRITHDLALKQTQSGLDVLRFTVAVDRYSKNGDDTADFLSCVAFGQRATFIEQYFGKGRMIAVEGSLKSGSYEKDGVKHYTTDIWVDNVSFTGEKKNDSSGGYSAPAELPIQEQKAEKKQTASRKAREKEVEAEQLSIGDLDDFEEIFSDGPVPF